jgi:hypothetical protein
MQHQHNRGREREHNGRDRSDRQHCNESLQFAEIMQSARNAVISACDTLSRCRARRPRDQKVEAHVADELEQQRSSTSKLISTSPRAI